jgi:hypothetical protein
VQYAQLPGDIPSDEFYERVSRAYWASLRKGRVLFLKLLQNPLSQVRLSAVLAGVKRGVPDVIAALPELVERDGAWSVEEAAMQILHEKSPDVLRGMVGALRRKFTDWRGEDDGYPVIHLAWVATDLEIAELAPQIRQIARDEAYDPYAREQALVWAAFLDQGPVEILRRIEGHDHEHMLSVCRLAWMKNLQGARQAYEQGASQAPDEDCQNTCQKFAAAADEAEAAGEPLTVRNRPV